MKILFHISSLFGGGAERVMSYLINHNCELNNEVYIVVCYEKKGEYYISPEAKKIAIGSHGIVSQSLELRKTIKRIKPDICVSFMQGRNIRLSLACMGLKQKYILSVRNDVNWCDTGLMQLTELCFKEKMQKNYSSVVCRINRV